MLIFECPACKTKLQAAEEHAGKTIQCPQCKQMSPVPPAANSSSIGITAHPGSASPPPTAVTTPDQVPSAKRHRERDDSGEREAASTAKAKGMGTGLILLLTFGVGGCCLLSVGTLVALMFPALKAVQGAADRTHTMNNMKQIVIACHNHHDAMRTFPSPRSGPRQVGMPAPDLSWRVTILPFIEQAHLFNGIDPTDAWNGPRNLKWLAMRPLVYESKLHPTPDTTVTHFQYFTGPKTMFPDPNRGTSFPQIPDGLSNTFMFAEAAAPVPWTKPADMAITPNGPLPLPTDRFLVGFADGSVRMIDRSKVDDNILRLFIDPADGNPTPAIED